MKRLLFVPMIALLTIVSSCNENAGSSNDNTVSDNDSTIIAEPAEEKDSTLLVMALTPTLDHLPFYAADHFGIYDSLGLNIELQTRYSDIDCDTLLSEDVVDIITSDIVRAIAMRTENKPVKAVASTSLRLHILSASESGITNMSQLNEKVFAVTRHSAIDYFTDKMLESNSLQPKSLNKPQINDMRTRAQMLNRNQYDGSILPQPYAAYSQCLGAHSIENTDNHNINLSVLLSKDSIIARRHDDIGKLIQAYNIASARLNSMYGTPAKGNDSKTSTVATKEMLKLLPAGIQCPDSVRLEARFPQASNLAVLTFKSALKWFEDQRLVPKDQPRRIDIEYTDLIDTTFCNNAKQ